MPDISSSDGVVIAGNGPSDWIALHAGQNRVAFHSAAWATAQVTVYESYGIDSDEADANECIAEKDGSDLVLTKNRIITLEGPGFVRAETASFSANITMKRVHPP